MVCPVERPDYCIYLIGKIYSIKVINYPLKTIIMKKIHLLLITGLFMLTISGCSVIEGIFKAGAVVGIVSVIVVILVIIWLISLFRGR